MKINKIDVEKNEATLSFNRHEVMLIRRALHKMSAELATKDDKWLLVEVNGIDDIMKDGNFTRFLSFHKSLMIMENEKHLQEEVSNNIVAKDLIERLLKYIFTPEGFEKLDKDVIEKAEAFLKEQCENVQSMELGEN